MSGKIPVRIVSDGDGSGTLQRVGVDFGRNHNFEVVTAADRRSGGHICMTAEVAALLGIGNANALTAQPAAKTGLTLDTGSSLYTGLVAYVVGFSAGSGGLNECYDFVSAAALTAAGTSPTFGTLVGENGFLPAQANANRVTLPDSADRDVIGDLTVYWRGSVTSGNAVNHSIVSKCTTNGTTATPYDVVVNNTSGQVTITRANTGFRLHTTNTGPLSYGSLQSVLIVSPEAIETIPTIYTNGTAQGVNLSSGTGTGAATANANTLNFGWRVDNGGVRQTGLFSLGAIWSRQLTAGEQASFNANPWQLLTT